jgi:Ca-activated chloride channel family protein
MAKVVKITIVFALIAGFPFARGQAARPDAGIPAVAEGSVPAVPSEWPQVILNVLVDAKKGATDPVPASSLEIIEDGTPQKIESIAGPGSPVSLCILIDVSGSMTSKQSDVRDAAAALVKGLPPDSEVTVSAFAEKSYLVLPFTRAEAVDLSLFGRLKFGHHTALNDSVIVAEQYFVKFARYPRRALVLITDGGENASEHGISDATHAMEAPTGPFVYVLEIFDPYAPTPEERWPVANFFPSTGVRIFRTSVAQDLPMGATEISQCIDRQYSLSYRSALTTPNKHLHKIQVRLPAPDPNIKIESLPGYYIPSK